MLSGRDTLASIDQALAQVHGQMQEVDTQIQQTSEQIVKLRRQEAQQYQQLANIRIKLMATGELASSLDHAHQQAVQLLEERTAAMGQLKADLESNQQELRALESERAEAAGTLESAEDRHDDAIAQTQSRLAEDEAYQQQLAAAQAADRVADQADEKTRVAELDRAEKGQPYEQDSLFRYLWERGYGTLQYRAWGPTRLLDGWVARLCGYQDARVNYAMLLEIPKRLREHAEAKRALADTELAQLHAMEAAAAETDGVPALEQSVAQARAALDALDQKIEAAETRQQEILKQRNSYAAGDDDFFRRATELLSAQLGRADLRQLRRDAEQTPLPDDDVIVQRLATAESERHLLESAQAEHRAVLVRHQKRLQELEQVRREFKRHRYDSPYSTFPQGALIAMMLNEFLRGVVSSDNLWREIERHHRSARRRADPSFGSGSIGRRRRIDPWGGGSGGGWGGGGFGTGGGFGGGGGFRTGGGF